MKQVCKRSGGRMDFYLRIMKFAMAGIMVSLELCTVKTFGKMTCSKTFFAVGFIVICAAGCRQKNSLPYYNTADFTPAWEIKNLKNPLHVIPPFSFIDQNSEVITDKNF